LTHFSHTHTLDTQNASHAIKLAQRKRRKNGTVAQEFQRGGGLQRPRSPPTRNKGTTTQAGVRSDDIDEHAVQTCTLCTFTDHSSPTQTFSTCPSNGHPVLDTDSTMTCFRLRRLQQQHNHLHSRVRTRMRASTAAGPVKGGGARLGVQQSACSSRRAADAAQRSTAPLDLPVSHTFWHPRRLCVPLSLL